MPDYALANLKEALEQELLKGSTMKPSLGACCIRKGVTRVRRRADSPLQLRQSLVGWELETADHSCHSWSTSVSEKRDLCNAYCI